MSCKPILVLFMATAIGACKGQTTSTTADAAASAAPVASASATPAASAAPQTAPPEGWWTEVPVAGSGSSATYMRFGPTEVASVKSLGSVEILDMKLLRGDATHWEWSALGAYGNARCTLDQDPSGARATFQCQGGAHAKTIALEPLKNAKRSKELDATIEKNRPPKDVCTVAEACGTKVFAQMNQKFDADKELGNPRSPNQCKKTLVGLRAMAQMNGAPPPECK